MNSHQQLATRLLSEEATRKNSLDVVYGLLVSEKAASLAQAVMGNRLG